MQETPRQATNSTLLVILGFGSSLILFVGLLTYGLAQVTQVHDRVQEIVSQHNTKERLIEEMHQAARERVLSLFSMAVTEDPFERDEIFLNFTANGGRFARARIALQEMPLTAEERIILDQQGSLTAKAVPLQDQTVELIKQERIDDAIALIANEALAAQNAVLHQLDLLSELQKTRAKMTGRQTAAEHEQARQLMIWLGTTATAVAIVIAVLITRRVRQAENNLTELNETLEKRVQERTRELAASNEQLQDTITTLQETQEQLIHSEKMASLGGLVAGISHEINTPVGIAVTAASNIEESATELDRKFASGELTKSDMSASLNHIKQGSSILLTNLRRASDLIRSFKQVAVDQASDECRELELHQYCDEILTSLQPQIKRHPVEVRNECPEGLHAFTNPGALYQIISNLVLNAVVHGYDEEQGGSVVIRASSGNGRACIDIIDDGKGIPQEHMNKVFDPFFTTRRGQGGSGLGLNIVYNLVTTKLGGKIQVRSGDAGGAHFTITFPVDSNNRT